MVELTAVPMAAMTAAKWTAPMAALLGLVMEQLNGE
jgi:hypothetical protein